MDESEKPRRKTNGTTRPNTKAPRGRNRNGRSNLIFFKAHVSELFYISI